MATIFSNVSMVIYDRLFVAVVVCRTSVWSYMFVCLLLWLVAERQYRHICLFVCLFVAVDCRTSVLSYMFVCLLLWLIADSATVSLALCLAQEEGRGSLDLCRHMTVSTFRFVSAGHHGKHGSSSMLLYVTETTRTIRDRDRGRPPRLSRSS